MGADHKTKTPSQAQILLTAMGLQAASTLDVRCEPEVEVTIVALLVAGCPEFYDPWNILNTVRRSPPKTPMNQFH